MDATIKQILQQHVKLESPVIFEIGAHECEDTNDFFQIFNNPIVYCFEPDPRNINTIKTKPIYGQIHLFEGAVTDCVKKAILYQSHGKAPEREYKDDWNYSSSIKTPTGHLQMHPWCTFSPSNEISCTSIDVFCDTNSVKNIDLIWCDAQGAEPDIILGASHMLPNISLILLEDEGVELYDGYKSIEVILSTMGNNWSIAKRFGHDCLLTNRAYCGLNKDITHDGF